MDPTCDFMQEYRPAEGSPDPEVIHHLKTCPDCQQEVYVVDNFSGAQGIPAKGHA